MPPFPARSRSGSPLALCKSFGGDATDRGTHRVVRSVENQSSRASVLINGDELAEISLLLGIHDVEAAMSWKTVSSGEWRKMAGKIGAWSAWAQDRWRAQNGDARKETGTEKGERPSRKGMKEQSKGAGGWLGGRWVSEVQKKKEEEKKEERERREEGKKIEAAVGIESLSGSRMPRVKIKERFARRSCYSSRFFSLFSFVPRMKFHCIEFCPGVCISLADYRWYRYCDINLSMKPLWLYRIRGSLKVIRFVMQNCSFCKKKENDRYGCVSVYKYLVIRIVSFFSFPFETCHWIFVHFFESFGMIEV